MVEINYQNSMQPLCMNSKKLPLKIRSKSWIPLILTSLFSILLYSYTITLNKLIQLTPKSMFKNSYLHLQMKCRFLQNSGDLIKNIRLIERSSKVNIENQYR